MKIVFIHGRSQEGKDPVGLKDFWLNSLVETTAGSKTPLKAASFANDVEFPYYGDELISLMTEGTKQKMSEEEVHRANDFIAEVDSEIVSKGFVPNSDGGDAKVTSAEDTLRHSDEEQVRGVLNWKLVRGVLGGVDKVSAKTSAVMVSAVLKDVAFYLENENARQKVDDIAIKSIETAKNGKEPILVVAHSLGTVVAYSALHKLAEEKGWQDSVHLITVGSPLAIGAVKLRMSKQGWPPFSIPRSVRSWINGSDVRDVVALVPRIDRNTFFKETQIPFDVVNVIDILNPTSNRHGIEGYLGDASIARSILQTAGL